MHQRDHRLIPRGELVGIDHRQRKARALQQRAQLAQIGKGRDTGRDTAFDLAFGSAKGFAQFA